eukprot:3514484-Pyramimonas_sp.AAC.1
MCDAQNGGKALPGAVARLGYHVVTSAVGSDWYCWHTTVLGWGFSRRSAIGNPPTLRQVNNAMQEFGPFDFDRFESAFLDLPGAVAHNSRSKPVRISIDWLGATRDLKQMRMNDAA